MADSPQTPELKQRPATRGSGSGSSRRLRRSPSADASRPQTSSPSRRRRSPSRSPSKSILEGDNPLSAINLRAAQFDDSTPFGRALNKVARAAGKFNKERDYIIIRGLESTCLTPDEFRDQLRRAFYLQFTEEEFEPLLDYFDKTGEGHIDGVQFLVKFAQIGFFERSRARSRQLELNREAQQQQREEEERRMRETLMRHEGRVATEFTDADRTSMEEKLLESAVRYDRYHPSAVGLDAFEASHMPPGVFREILKRTFNLKLTDGELAAAVAQFGDDDGRVDCGEFLVKFMRSGFKTRWSRRSEWLKTQSEQVQQAEQERREKLHKLEHKLDVGVDREFTEADRQRALTKLREAAFKYDKHHPSSVSLDAFDSTTMTPGVFREMLKRTFNIRTTNAELGALIEHFDKTGDGEVDCAEFLVSFAKMGFEERSRVTREARERDAKLRAEMEEEIRRKKEEAEKKNEMAADYEFTDEERESALAKMTDAAVKYDKNHPSAMGLEGFDGSSMAPGVFREMLKRTFNLRLTDRELGALIKHFDKDGDGTIDCAEFLVSFCKLGFEKRSQTRSEWLERDRELQARAIKEAEDKLREVRERADFRVDMDFTDEDRESALQKMTEAATKYDRYHPSAVALDGFDARSLTPGQFREMVKRTFNLKLTNPELAALIKEFAIDDEGNVGCDDFLVAFITTGYRERANERREWLQRQREMSHEAQLEAEQKLRDIEERAEFSLDLNNFTEEDRTIALALMTEAAAKYDRYHPASVSLDGFLGSSLTVGQFREMLKRTFNLRLTDGQLAALITEFDRDGNGMIDNSEFLVMFTRLGFAEKARKRSTWLKQQRADNRRAQQEQERKLREAEERSDMQLDLDDFTPEDRTSALSKLTYAAARYDRYHPGSVGLDGFVSVTATPGQFREMLKRTFNLRLSNQELAALVREFDPDRTGLITNSEFLVTFTRLGYEERTRIKREWLDKQRKMDNQAKEEAERKLQDIEERAEFTISNDFSAEDQQAAMEKLTEAAALYDRFHPSSVGLDGFDTTSVSVGQFRELLKRTFNLKLSDPELASLVALFDKTGENRVDCSEFLVTFTRIGYDERNRKMREQRERQRRMLEMAKEEAELKEAKKKRKSELTVAAAISPADEESAMAKLTAAAKKYDKSHPASMGIDGFDARTLAPGAFKEMLKRTFNLKPTPAEFAVYVKKFDLEGNGYIHCGEFLKQFLKLGHEQRMKQERDSRIRQQEELKRAEEEMAAKLQAQAHKLDVAADYNFTDAEREDAIHKLRVAATKFDKAHPSSMSLEAFDTAEMTPGVFREMLKRTFNLRLTNKELGAIVQMFDTTNTQHVNCQLFLLHFFKLGFTEREKFHRAKLQEDRARRAQAAEEARRKQEELEQKNKAATDFNFSEEDFNRAMNKVAIAASRYDKNHPSSMTLEGFEGASMTPVVFREMLKRTFNVKLDAKELGAVIQYFDSDGDGTIDSAEFLLHFFKLGFGARSKRHTERAQRVRELVEESKREEQRKAQLKLEEERRRLNFTPADEESVMRKLRECARRYALESTSVSDQLSAFKGPAMDAKAFREIFRHVFHTKLTFAEMGALLQVFDNTGDGMIDGPEFLSVFFRMARVEQQLILGVEDVEQLTLHNLRPRAASPVRAGSQRAGRRSPSSSRLGGASSAGHPHPSVRNPDSDDEDFREFESMVSTSPSKRRKKKSMLSSLERRAREQRKEYMERQKKRQHLVHAQTLPGNVLIPGVRVDPGTLQTVQKVLSRGGTSSASRAMSSSSLASRSGSRRSRSPSRRSPSRRTPATTSARGGTGSGGEGGAGPETHHSPKPRRPKAGANESPSKQADPVLRSPPKPVFFFPALFSPAHVPAVGMASPQQPGGSEQLPSTTGPSSRVRTADSRRSAYEDDEEDILDTNYGQGLDGIGGIKRDGLSQSQPLPNRK